MAKNAKRHLTEREKEYRREYYKAHKERMNAQTRAWWEQNHEHHLALQREWYSDNREKHLADTKTWAAAHLPAKALARRRRRAVLAGASGTCTEAQLEDRVAFFGRRCSYCGGPYEEVDHAIPLARGGTNWPSNLRTSCRRCNRKKHTKTFFEFCGVS